MISLISQDRLPDRDCRGPGYTDVNPAVSYPDESRPCVLDPATAPASPKAPTVGALPPASLQSTGNSCRHDGYLSVCYFS
ncbi:MAG: hypothetical protein HOP23_06995 [Methylococcaceae bacterium]|nr:hypothetical protein [Methylococcaceae bacterium]